MGNAMWRTGELQRKVGFNPPCLRITRTDMTPAPILARRSALASDSVRGGRARYGIPSGNAAGDGQAHCTASGRSPAPV